MQKGQEVALTTAARLPLRVLSGKVQGGEGRGKTPGVRGLRCGHAECLCPLGGRATDRARGRCGAAALRRHIACRSEGCQSAWSVLQALARGSQTEARAEPSN